jgi:hypothetical protein
MLARAQHMADARGKSRALPSNPPSLCHANEFRPSKTWPNAAAGTAIAIAGFPRLG